MKEESGKCVNRYIHTYISGGGKQYNNISLMLNFNR